jgi:hypothetical protein
MKEILARGEVGSLKRLANKKEKYYFLNCSFLIVDLFSLRNLWARLE